MTVINQSFFRHWKKSIVINYNHISIFKFANWYCLRFKVKYPFWVNMKFELHYELALNLNQYSYVYMYWI